MELTIIFITICVITLIAMMWSQKKKGNYDERQEAIRNRGYKYGFFTITIVAVLMMYLEMFNIKFSNYLFSIIPLYCGCFVASIYDVINQAYFRMKEKHMTGNGFLLIVCGLMEAYFCITSLNQDFTSIVTFGMLAVYLIIMGIAILYVNYRSKRDDA
ncbi:DUF6442 family protein [Lactobacillus sp. LL6]|uniref:DUF6442 family protein n=1 Tax=Lactobacillus sp. LL6 TaxID=2596827 RepID=UPI0011848662|nr:DUF6442 family protein [Lactobacillus sp. LL6]TSO26331.1 hypothetical protein FOD82_04495 [Lactobacillus sp. LL6]